MNANTTEQPSELEVLGECISDDVVDYNYRFVDSNGRDKSQILPWEDDGTEKGGLVAYLKDEKGNGYKVALSNWVFPEGVTEAVPSATEAVMRLPFSTTHHHDNDNEAHPVPSETPWASLGLTPGEYAEALAIQDAEGGDLGVIAKRFHPA